MVDYLSEIAVLIESDGEVLKRPKIEFPCLYPIKIIGCSVENFKGIVISQVERHTGPIDLELITVKKSRKNNYISVNITIAASGEKQLGKIFEDLKRIKSVKMVL